MKNPPTNAVDVGDPWVGEDPLEEEMATLLQYSCLENSTDRGAWQARVGHD